MKLEQVMSSEELKTARVSKAYFGRLVGVSAVRVSQLAAAGLLVVDDSGVRLIESLRRFYLYRNQKGCDSLAEFVWRLENETSD